MRVGTRLGAFLGLVAAWALIVHEDHRPGDFHSTIVGLGMIMAAFGAILGIMQTRGEGRIAVAAGDNSLERYANSRRAVIATLVVGVVIALQFPSL